MDMTFMDEYFERMRADDIEKLSTQHNDEFEDRAKEYSNAKKALIEGLGLTHLFDRSHTLTLEEKNLWRLFDRVEVAEIMARDALAKGAYMVGAEDRERMLR